MLIIFASHRYIDGLLEMKMAKNAPSLMIWLKLVEVK